MNFIFSVITLANMVSPLYLWKFKPFMIFLNPSLSASCVGLFDSWALSWTSSNLMQPLHALLTTSKPKSQTLAWNDAALATFKATNEALANASLLSYPKADAPTCLMTDDNAMKAVCQLASHLFLF